MDSSYLLKYFRVYALRNAFKPKAFDKCRLTVLISYANETFRVAININKVLLIDSTKRKFFELKNLVNLNEK